jgi:transglutaminase-like putative cysteine protease
MARAVKTVILLFWIVMTGMLIHRTYLRPASVIALDAVTQEGIRPGDEWFSIFQEGRKIGHAHTSIAVDGDAYRLSEDSDMDILALGRVQRVRTAVTAYTTRAFLLKYFDFSLRTDSSTMDVKGAVVRNQLVVDIATAGETRTMRLPLSGPVYLTPHIRPAVVLLGLEPGRRYRFPLFNPATLSTEDAFVTVEGRDTIKVGDADRTVYRLRESFQGMEATAWITPEGDTIKEESPLGYTLLRETREEALKRGKDGPVVDIVSLVRIESTPIGDPGQVRSLKARLSGAPLAGFELDGGRQSWSGGIIEVRTEQHLRDLSLPLAAPGTEDALRPTALVQSDDRGVRDQAARVVGRERSALQAAKKLSAWVYEAITKQPVVSIPSAVEVLKQRVGDCNEHTTLYTALARAAGIPTRMAAGIVYLKNGFYYHAWPEVWLGEWVAVDPTFNQFPADATHIRFVTGELGRQAEIMKLVGKLKVDVIEYR